MGEIADSIIDGEFDYITGEYLGEGVGYPRSIYDNYQKPKSKKKGSPHTGLHKFISLNIRRKNNPNVGSYCNIIILKYGEEVLGLKDLSPKQVSNIITKDFKSFKTWFFEIYKKTYFI